MRHQGVVDRVVNNTAVILIEDLNLEILLQDDNLHEGDWIDLTLDSSQNVIEFEFNELKKAQVENSVIDKLSRLQKRKSQYKT